MDIIAKEVQVIVVGLVGMECKIGMKLVMIQTQFRQMGVIIVSSSLGFIVMAGQAYAI